MRAAARGYAPLAGIALPGPPDPSINLAQTFSYSPDWLSHQWHAAHVLAVDNDGFLNVCRARPPCDPAALLHPAGSRSIGI